jgi:hypothetical protein
MDIRHIIARLLKRFELFSLCYLNDSLSTRLDVQPRLTGRRLNDKLKRCKNCRGLFYRYGRDSINTKQRCGSCATAQYYDTSGVDHSGLITRLFVQ